jgi:pyruvate/2-oxoacid:ferredoxin oxidoreductase beta subunit
MATHAKIFPIYEIENDQYTINVYPERQLAVKEYLQAQGRFRQMPPEMISAAQESADRKWEELVTLAHND